MNEDTGKLIRRLMLGILILMHGFSKLTNGVGWMDDLQHMRWQDARDWYRDWYAPNNAYVVVVGDVDHRAVFRLAEQTYGRHKAKPLPVSVQAAR